MNHLNGKRVRLTLVGLNGNAYSLMGAFQHAAKQQGFTKEQIDAVLTDAKHSDYDHLLRVLIEHCEDEDEE